MKKLISVIAAAAIVFTLFQFVSPSFASGEIDEAEALYFDVKPEIDGIVTDAEWGEPTVLVDRRDAASTEDTEPVNNRFFMRNTAAQPDCRIRAFALLLSPVFIICAKPYILLSIASIRTTEIR